MPLLTDSRWAVALLFITPAQWSVNYLVGRIAPGIIAPHMLALLHWCPASGCVNGWGSCSGWPLRWLLRV